MFLRFYEKPEAIKRVNYTDLKFSSRGLIRVARFFRNFSIHYIQKNVRLINIETVNYLQASFKSCELNVSSDLIIITNGAVINFSTMLSSSAIDRHSILLCEKKVQTLVFTDGR